MGLGTLRRYHDDSAAVGAADESVAPTHEELVENGPAIADADKQSHAQTTPLTEGDTSSAADPAGVDTSNNEGQVNDAESDGDQHDADDALADEDGRLQGATEDAEEPKAPGVGVEHEQPKKPRGKAKD